MPFLLKYDQWGNCIGGHEVAGLPDSSQYPPPPTMMAQDPSPYGAPLQQHAYQRPPQPDTAQQQFAMPQQNFAAHAPPNFMSQQHVAPVMPGSGGGTELLHVPPTGTAYSNQPSWAQFEPLGYTQCPNAIGGGPPPDQFPPHVPYGGSNLYQPPAQQYQHQAPRFGGQPYSEAPRYQPLLPAPANDAPASHHWPGPPEHMSGGQSHQAPFWPPDFQGYPGHTNFPRPAQSNPDFEPSSSVEITSCSVPREQSLTNILTIEDFQKQHPPPIVSQPNLALEDFEALHTEIFGASPTTTALTLETAPTTQTVPVDQSQNGINTYGADKRSGTISSPINPTSPKPPTHPKMTHEPAADEAYSGSTQFSRARSAPPADDEHQWMKKAEVSVAEFTEHLQKNANTMASFDILCRDYNKGAIDDSKFYGGVRNLLARDNALHLMSGFHLFLPAVWKGADLSWLDIAIELEQENADAGSMKQDDAGAQTTSKSKSKKKKKKRPKNGFSTSDGPGDFSRQVTAATGLPLLAPKTKEMEQQDKDQSRQDQLELDAIPVKQSKEAQKGDRAPLRPADSANPFDPSELNRLGKNRFGAMLASQVKHVGRVYTSRRDVIARDSKPYIHLCGARFKHPADVKFHHKQHAPKCLIAAGHNRKEKIAWDEHPSCKLTYPMVNYTKVQDGYIILDQESIDTVESYVQAGLQWCEEHPDDGTGFKMEDGIDSGVKEDNDEVDEEDRIEEELDSNDASHDAVESSDQVVEKDELSVQAGSEAMPAPAAPYKKAAPAPTGLNDSPKKSPDSPKKSSGSPKKSSGSPKKSSGSPKKSSLARSEQDNGAMVRAAALGLRMRK